MIIRHLINIMISIVIIIVSIVIDIIMIDVTIASDAHLRTACPRAALALCPRAGP